MLTRGTGRAPEAIIDRPPAVLIVEDEPMIRMAAADMFVEAGYSVLEAGHAAEALDILEAHGHIGAVFTDIEMPGEMNGLVLASVIRGRWPSIAILVTSGRVQPCEGALPFGAGFVEKPYCSLNVISTITEMVHLDRT